MTNYNTALKLIVSNPEQAINFLNLELSMPNISTPTAGGEVFWTNLSEYNGWRLQQNMVTKHARILRSDDVRVAWGTVNGMYKALDRLVASMNERRYVNSVFVEDSNVAAEKLKRLKELLDMGVITQDEYNKKKAELINLI